ncbi:hypothetical protein OXX79_005033, partial [Metschnikowia pulcherrima]
AYTVQTFARRWRGYRRLNSVDIEPSPVATEESTGRADEEEAEVAIDDIRSSEDAAVRSTSPVRPLGRQFLNTFRT